VDEIAGLRERKKVATRRALHEAAVRLASTHGLERVTVEAIADAAEVSRRTFSNYFSSKEEALFYGEAERVRRLLRLVSERPPDEEPWTSLCRAAEGLVAELEPERGWLEGRRALQSLRSHPAVAAHRLAAYSTVETELAGELVSRLNRRRSTPDAVSGGGRTDIQVELHARMLGAMFLAAVRVAIAHWVDDPKGPLVDSVRAALAAVAPETD
jgi:AcrR family transcriptional regulator